MSAQQEFPSFKLLLKQVYTAHSSKVKELENEIKILKEKLNENERKSNISTSDCKRCIELEEAFKTCKKALSEQSKWFENFGQKFSIFNSSQFENQDFKDNFKSSIEQETTSSSRNLKEETVKSGKIDQDDDDLQNYEKLEIKLSGAANNQNLLNKVMFDGESYDAYTVTFNKNLKLDNLNVKSDSLVLAPDTLNNVSDDQKIHETGFKERFIKEVEKGKVSEKERITLKEPTEKERITLKEPTEKESIKVKETKATHKRLSSESLNEDRAKRCYKGNISDISSERTINIKEIHPDMSVPKMFEISDLTDNPKSIENKINPTTEFCSKNDKKCRSKISLESVKPSRENKTETPKSSTVINNPISDLKSLLNHTSPSLIQKPLNVPAKIIDLESTPNDDDFQELIPSTKPVPVPSPEDAWESSDRKKLLKKSKSLRQIKSTTKYKMTLDAPPLNYKKPNYKQTKLSKSIFQTMTSNANKKSSTTSKNNLVLQDEEEDYTVPSALPDNLKSSTPIDAVISPTVVDIDATFIPENFKSVSPIFNTTNVKKNTVEKSNLKNGNLFGNISFPDELKSSVRNKRPSVEDKDEIIDDFQCSEEVEFKENMNSFDRLPMPEEPKYKYKNDVVRKKAERKQLNGFGCKECEKYYSDLGLSEKEKKERMKKCSRHRGKFSPPATPDHFWELDFPDTQECRARGYLNATQKVKLNNICDI